ncbi:MAG TPA: transcriptional regulator [Bacteroidales bacterium]|jgi:LacI family transcriptional regulator|nr:transcriptional regulator [Bacteroidales bacterium]
MTTKSSKIRIKDIAEKAGVSIGTVDRVLHNRGDVRSETREKILQIVKEMGYTPNLFAKSLASKKTYRLAVLIPDSNDNPYWKHPKSGIIKAADEIKSFNTSVNIFPFNATDEASFRNCFIQVLRTEPNGIVFNPVFREASFEFIELMEAKNIPFVYIDTFLEKSNCLAYFGQNAKQSGRVAAKILSQILPENGEVLIVKLANRKVISHHLKNREEGFIEFFNEQNKCNCKFTSLIIDLLDSNEPNQSLYTAFKTHPNINGIFVPNSRVFKVANYLKENNKTDILCLGYDLLHENIDFIEENVIDYIIGQRPEDQGYHGVMALFNHIALKKVVNKSNYSPIDIIIKENINYYNY